MPFVLLLAAILRDGRTTAARPVAAVLFGYMLLAAYIIQSHYAASTPADMLLRAETRLQTIGAGFQYAFDGHDVRSEYDAALAGIRRAAPLRKLEGTSDIYSVDQAVLIASGNDWDPRPIMQSYSAYEPVLAQLNSKHLTGAKAPDNIIFALQPIDGRVPSLADGASWPELMSRYTLTDFDGRYAHLRRLPDGGSAIEETERATRRHRLGESFAVPDSDGPVFAKIDIRPTLLGKLVNVLFKIPSLYLKLTMEDGTVRIHRTVSGMMSSGFFISPMVKSTRDFMYLISGNQDILSGENVKTAEIVTSFLWLHLWQSSFLVRFSVVHPERQPIPRTLMSTKTRAFAATMGSVPACEGVIDFVNGKHIGAGTKTAGTRRILTLNGWLTEAKGIDGVPPNVLVRVVFEDSSTAFYEASRTPRNDVKRHFKAPKMADVGFSATIEVDGRAPAVSFSIVAAQGQTAISCDNLRVDLRNPT